MVQEIVPEYAPYSSLNAGKSKPVRETEEARMPLPEAIRKLIQPDTAISLESAQLSGSGEAT
ncbi:hypothetical protein D9M71_836470 [compost metagenome]